MDINTILPPVTLPTISNVVPAASSSANTAPSTNTNVGTDIALSNNSSTPSNNTSTVVTPATSDHVSQMINSGQAKASEAFNIKRSSFALFKLPDGKVYSRVRDLDTGKITYYPAITPSSYAKVMEVAKGNIHESKV